MMSFNFIIKISHIRIIDSQFVFPGERFGLEDIASFRWRKHLEKWLELEPKSCFAGGFRLDPAISMDV